MDKVITSVQDMIGIKASSKTDSVIAVIIAFAVIVLTVLYLIFSKLHKKQNTPKIHLVDKSRKQVTLAEKIIVSHDTRRFRFALPDPNSVLGLPIGKHIKVYAPNSVGVEAGSWNGREDSEFDKEEIERKYTPISSKDTIGYFELMIKIYKGGVDEKFVDGGKMSQYLDNLKVGSTLDMSGSYGLHEYLGNGEFMMMKKKRKFNKIGCIAGGTGITPMYQLISHVLKDPNDKTELFLLYANKTESDILIRDMLEDLEEKHPDRFRLHYTVDTAPSDKEWNYSEGFIDTDMIQEHMPPPDDQNLILICGPPPMIKFACKPNLDKLGYSKQCIKEC